MDKGKCLPHEKASPQVAPPPREKSWLRQYGGPLIVDWYPFSRTIRDFPMNVLPRIFDATCDAYISHHSLRPRRGCGLHKMGDLLGKIVSRRESFKQFVFCIFAKLTKSVTYEQNGVGTMQLVDFFFLFTA